MSVTVPNPLSGAIAVPTSPVIVVNPVFVMPVLARTAKGAAAPSETGVLEAVEKSRPNPVKGNTRETATTASKTTLFDVKIYRYFLGLSVSGLFTPCEAQVRECEFEIHAIRTEITTKNMFASVLKTCLNL